MIAVNGVTRKYSESQEEVHAFYFPLIAYSLPDSSETLHTF